MDHGEHFLRTYESRFGESHGPLPPQAEKVIDKLVGCGDLAEWNAAFDEYEDGLVDGL